MAATLRINKEHNGLELIFPDSERPDANIRKAMKDFGFRWHNTGRYWFARQTDERLKFARQLSGEGEREVSEQSNSPQPKPSPKKEKTPATAKEENTFAAVYDTIGSFPIQDGSQMDVHSIPAGIYCADLNALFRHTWGYDDCISITDLTNAGKTGKSCTTWRLFCDEKSGIISNELANKEGIRTCAQLLQSLKEGKTFDSIKLYSSEDKGIEVFSPFVEVKPLAKLPDEWNKRNFTQALLSGQIYMGHVDYRYTDDYALDAANDFSRGVGISIPNFARDVVENWYSTAYVHAGSKDAEKGTGTIGYSEHSNSSKTLYFDVNCNIREGKRRADERSAGIEAYNNMMKASCIEIAPESIDEDKIYSVTSLDTYTNSGVCATKTENIQGSALLRQLDPDCRFLEILSVQELQIIPDKLYEIASFYHSRNYCEPDDRILDMGNSLQLVTGKALLELTAEGQHFPHIVEATGEYYSIEAARDTLNKFISGEKRFMFTGLKEGGYELALQKLNKEAERAGHINRRSGIDDLIANAQQKAAAQSGPTKEKNMDVIR